MLSVRRQSSQTPWTYALVWCGNRGAQATRDAAARDTWEAPSAPLRALTRLSAQPLTNPEQLVWNWEDPDLIWRRSRLGVRSGVYEVTSCDDCIVLKSAPQVLQEVVAAHLAKELRISTPLMRLDRQPPKSVRRRIGGGDAPVMMMRFIAGRAFKELTLEDRKRIVDGIGTPQSVLYAMGRIVAFDYLISNPDRFPVAGLQGNNPGNLMLDIEGVHAIDNTLPLLVVDPRDNRAFRALEQVLQLLLDPDNAEAAACLAPITQYFPEGWDLSWETIRGDIIAGFRQQVLGIAQLKKRRIVGICRAVFGRVGTKNLEALLVTSHRLFQKVAHTYDARA